MPEAVTSFGAVTAGDWLYVGGGHRGQRHEYHAGSVSGAFHRLNLASGSAWESLPPLPPAQGAPLVAHRERILRPGGMTPRNRAGAPPELFSRAELLIYDPGLAAWREGPPMPQPRSSHDAVVAGDTLYIGGGWCLDGPGMGGRWLDRLWRLDLAKPDACWESLPQPFRRRALAMATEDRRVWFLGGIDDDGAPSRRVDVLELGSGGWSRGPDLPEGPMNGFGASAIGLGGRIFFSGMGGEILELASDGSGWRVAGRLRRPRFFHQLVTAGQDGLIALGGEGGDCKLDDLEVHRPSSAPGS